MSNVFTKSEQFSLSNKFTKSEKFPSYCIIISDILMNTSYTYSKSFDFTSFNSNTNNFYKTTIQNYLKTTHSISYSLTF